MQAHNSVGRVIALQAIGHRFKSGWAYPVFLIFKLVKKNPISIEEKIIELNYKSGLDKH